MGRSKWVPKIATYLGVAHLIPREPWEVPAQGQLCRSLGFPAASPRLVVGSLGRSPYMYAKDQPPTLLMQCLLKPLDGDIVETADKTRRTKGK